MGVAVTPFNAEREQAWSLWLHEFVGQLRAISKPVKSSFAFWSDAACEYRCLRHAPRRAYADGTEVCDSQEFCGKCGRILDHCFTTYGEDEEIGYSSSDEMAEKPIGPEEAFTLANVICCGVPKLTERWPDFDLRSDLRPALSRIARRLAKVSPPNPRRSPRP